MAESTVTIRVDEDLSQAFTQAAKAGDRTAAQLLSDFMRQYVEDQAGSASYEAWVRRKVDAARQAIRDGHVRSDDEVDAYFAARRAQIVRRVAEPGS